ncbi:MAG: aminotransferase class V-fold PLP-dependent enzyme [Acutalibacteraceae bacterium]
MIYLDNAATSFPKPQSVLKTMYNSMAFCGGNPGRGGHRLSASAGEKVFSCRKTLGEFFGCESENVIFTNNCTTALNTVIFGTLKKGDHVVISSLEHNSVLRPVHALKEKEVISYSVAYVDPLSDENTLRNFTACFRPNTKAVIITMVSNVFGTVLPYKKIASLCKDRGILFILDASQGVPFYKVNVKDDGISALCLPGHKGLMGPMGAGALLLNENLSITPLTFGGTGSNSMSPLQGDFYPESLESGTVNFPGIVGFEAGIKAVKSLGEKYIREKESELIKTLKEDLYVIEGLEVYDKMHGKNESSVLSFNVDGLHSEQTSELLDRDGICTRGGYHCSMLSHKNYGTEEKGAVRVSVGPFNSKKDIKIFAFCLNKIAKYKKMC